MKKKVYIKEPVSIWGYKWLAMFYIRFFMGFRHKSRYKPDKDEKIVVLSNHQTDLDPFIVRIAMNRYMYTLSSDNIYSRPLIAKILTRMGGIPKRKGVADFESIKKILQLSKDGASILIFPEGNRSYAEFQFYIADNFASLLYKLKSTIVLYNIHGGFGVSPRFGYKLRKGPFYGEVKRVLKYDEYKDMSAEELNAIIKEELQVFDSDSGALYRSNHRAEYLERMFFICPKCQKMNTLTSKGNIIKCHCCGLEVMYEEDLTLKSSDSDFKYHRLVDWYDYQKDYLRNLEIKDELIFKDDDVSLAIVNPFKRYKLLAKGQVRLFKDRLEVGNVSLPVTNIMSASPMSGRKLCFTYDGDNYQIKGPKRFNALKYALIFHKLDTKMHRENLDNYYNI